MTLVGSPEPAVSYSNVCDRFRPFTVAVTRVCAVPNEGYGEKGELRLNAAL